jgi:hypothetical protein
MFVQRDLINAFFGPHRAIASNSGEGSIHKPLDLQSETSSTDLLCDSAPSLGIEPSTVQCSTATVQEISPIIVSNTVSPRIGELSRLLIVQ